MFQNRHFNETWTVCYLVKLEPMFFLKSTGRIALKSTVVLFCCRVAVWNASGSVCLFDFEDSAQRVLNISNASLVAGCVRSWATSGEWSFRFAPAVWKEGLNEWPSVNLMTPVNDWSKYDRLVLDVVNLGSDPSDSLSLFLSRADGPVTEGLRPQSLLMPAEGFVRWVVSLDKWPKKTPPTAIGRVHVFIKRPRGAEVYIDSITLLEKGEAVPPIESAFVKECAKKILLPRLRGLHSQFPNLSSEVSVLEGDISTLVDQKGFDGLKERIADLIAKGKHLAAYETFRQQCHLLGQAGDGILLGWATSMEKVLPRGKDAPLAIGKEVLKVRLSQNEREAFQIFVAADGCDLSSVEVSSSDLVDGKGNHISAANVECSAIGYVKTRPPPYKVAYTVKTNSVSGYETKISDPEIGWWPDPILSYLKAAEVKGTDIQGFWISVTCPKKQCPGAYSGILKVRAAKVNASERIERIIPFNVRVNDFTLSDALPLPLVITFAPDPSEESPTVEERRRVDKIRADLNSPVRIWRRHEKKWRDFLADYGFTVPDGLYHARMDSPLPNFKVLQELRSAGRKIKFNLGYWGYPQSLKEEDKEKWRKSTIPRLRKRYEQAKAENLLQDAYIYGCDEVYPQFFKNIEWAVSCLKREFPDVPLMSTAYDGNYGVGSVLSGIDWFTPTPDKFDPKKAQKAREQGRQVWWYICCNPLPPYANMFIESRAIEGRILMGAQTVRMKPDGFLYYQTAKWNAKCPISGNSTFTDWVARSWTTYNGDGSWLCCGPGGIPLSTIRLENFRDGLEDLAYARILEKELNDSPDAPWAAEARKLLSVPESLMESMANYNDDPQALYEWRNRMADLIEER